MPRYPGEEYLLDVDQIGAGPVSTAKNSSSEGEEARAGVVARLKYDYASKYVAEASLRYDGSDNFPRGKRWGTFYARLSCMGHFGRKLLADIKRPSYLRPVQGKSFLWRDRFRRHRTLCLPAIIRTERPWLPA